MRKFLLVICLVLLSSTACAAEWKVHGNWMYVPYLDEGRFHYMAIPTYARPQPKVKQMSPYDHFIWDIQQAFERALGAERSYRPQ